MEKSAHVVQQVKDLALSLQQLRPMLWCEFNPRILVLSHNRNSL